MPNEPRRVRVLLAPKAGPFLRINTTLTDYKALDAWFRDPASANVPVSIPNADNPADVRTFYPSDIGEIALISPFNDEEV